MATKLSSARLRQIIREEIQRTNLHEGIGDDFKHSLDQAQRRSPVYRRGDVGAVNAMLSKADPTELGGIAPLVMDNLAQKLSGMQADQLSMILGSLSPAVLEQALGNLGLF